MKLGVDIDGVLYDWDQAARETLEYGKAYGMPEPLTEAQLKALWKSPSSWGYIETVVGKANIDWLWRTANDTELFLKGTDYTESIRAVAELARDHEVYLITSRPKANWWQTYQWLSCICSLDYLANLAGVLHVKGKVQTAKGLALDVVVDDRPTELERYRTWAIEDTSGQAPLIYGVRRPWNHKVDHGPGIIHWIDSLAELTKEPWA